MVHTSTGSYCNYSPSQMTDPISMTLVAQNFWIMSIFILIIVADLQNTTSLFAIVVILVEGDKKDYLVLNCLGSMICHLQTCWGCCDITQRCPPLDNGSSGRTHVPMNQYQWPMFRSSEQDNGLVETGWSTVHTTYHTNYGTRAIIKSCSQFVINGSLPVHLGEIIQKRFPIRSGLNLNTSLVKSRQKMT